MLCSGPGVRVTAVLGHRARLGAVCESCCVAVATGVRVWNPGCVLRWCAHGRRRAVARRCQTVGREGRADTDGAPSGRTCRVHIPACPTAFKTCTRCRTHAKHGQRRHAHDGGGAWWKRRVRARFRAGWLLLASVSRDSGAASWPSALLPKLPSGDELRGRAAPRRGVLSRGVASTSPASLNARGPLRYATSASHAACSAATYAAWLRVRCT